MRRPRRRTVVILAAAAVVVAAAATVVIVADNSLVVQGGAGATGPGSESAPVIAGLAELHNSGPWPVSVTSITSPTAELEFSLTPVLGDGGGLAEPGPMVEAGEVVELAPGETLYLWLSLAPDGENPAAVSAIDVHYAGVLGIPFTEHSTVLSLLAFPSDLPPSVATIEGDEAAALDYVATVRAALAERDYASLAVIMGGDSTVEDAEAFWRQQEGVTDVTGFQTSGQAPSWLASFSSNLPDFFVTWENYRWTLSS